MQVWLQEFAWTEADKPIKLAARSSMVPKNAELARWPMFCFETMMKLLYWSCFVYDHMRVCTHFLHVATLCDCLHTCLLSERWLHHLPGSMQFLCSSCYSMYPSLAHSFHASATSALNFQASWLESLSRNQGASVSHLSDAARHVQHVHVTLSYPFCTPLSVSGYGAHKAVYTSHK